MPIQKGQVLWLTGVIYRPEGRPFERGGIEVNLLVSWQRSAEEPWYVVTTLESAEHHVTLRLDALVGARLPRPYTPETAIRWSKGFF